MPEFVYPPLLFFGGALLVALLRGTVRRIVALLVPLAALATLPLIERGTSLTTRLLDFDLVLVRGDAWSLIFLSIFTVVAFVAILYLLRDGSGLDLVAGLVYAGSAVGVVLAGDLITLFLYWEMLTSGAVMCLLARRTVASGRAAYRYLLVHVLGGVVLLAGIVIHLASGGSAEVGQIELSGPGAWLIFFGVGINCAWPVVGAWLTDTYPEASIGGILFMASFTTKSAVYVLARVFPGAEPLVWIGVAMATIPLFYAIISNDLRRVLAYCLINQVGFMVIGVGLGTGLSLNGTAAHAYCHILYKALLFMAIGAVIQQTGRSKATELGGLYRSMPLTCALAIVGAMGMSVPFFGGFVSKSLILGAVAKEGETVVWLVLLFASAGVFLASGIKPVYFAFFGRDSGVRCSEAPGNQLLAMAIVAVLLVVVGTFPGGFFYAMLPNPDFYDPYTVGHVADQFALLCFVGLAFALLVRSGLYPAEIRSTNLDFDWFYRKGGAGLYRVFDKGLNGLNAAAARYSMKWVVDPVTNFFESGASRAAAWVMTPIWIVRGFDEERREDARQVLFRRAKRGAFPIGLTAFCAVVLLGLLSVIFLLER